MTPEERGMLRSEMLRLLLDHQQAGTISGCQCGWNRDRRSEFALREHYDHLAEVLASRVEERMALAGQPLRAALNEAHAYCARPAGVCLPVKPL